MFEDPSHNYRNLSDIENIKKRIAVMKAQLATCAHEDPKKQALWMDIIEAYLQAGHYDETVQEIQAFEAEFPLSEVTVQNLAKQFHGLATSYREKQVFEQAEIFYQHEQELLEKLDNTVDAHRNVQVNFFRDFGIYYLTQKKYQQAAEMFEKGIAVCTTEALAKFLLPMRNYQMLALGLSKDVTKMENSLSLLAGIRATWQPVADREQSMDFASHLYHSARIREKWIKHLLKQDAAANAQVASDQADLAISDLQESLRLRQQLVWTSIDPTYRHSRLADPCWLLGKLLCSTGKLEAGRSYLVEAEAHYTVLASAAYVAKAGRIETKWLRLDPPAARQSVFSASIIQIDGSLKNAPLILEHGKMHWLDIK